MALIAGQSAIKTYLNTKWELELGPFLKNLEFAYTIKGD